MNITLKFKKKMSIKRKKNIKFLAIYNSFSENEKIEFGKFINIGLSGKKRNYGKILSSMKINENGIVEIQDAYSDRTRWNRLSELHLLAEKFLTFKSAESDSLLKRFLLLNEYNKRNLSLPFVNGFIDMKKTLTKEPVVNYDYYILYKLESYYLKGLKSKTASTIFADNLIRSGYIRTAVYLIDMLENLLELYNEKLEGVISSIEREEEFLKSFDFDNILLRLSENSKSGDKLFQIIKFLHLIYLGNKDPLNNDYLIKAKKIFIKDLKSVSKEKKEKYYFFMFNLIVERINIAVSGSYEELFLLMNKKLKEGLTDDILNKNISINKFRNYVLTAVELGKLKWANDFIKKYGLLLPPDFRDDCVFMGKALIALHMKKYLICKELLDKVKKRNSYYYIDASVMKLKVLFELKIIDECHDELKNLNGYLRKERFIQNNFKVYAKEFCKAYSLLIKLYQNSSVHNLSELEFLLSKNNFIGKKWITLKKEEILNKRNKNISFAV